MNRGSPKKKHQTTRRSLRTRCCFTLSEDEVEKLNRDDPLVHDCSRESVIGSSFCVLHGQNVHKTLHSIQPALSDEHTNVGTKLSGLDLAAVSNGLSNTDLAYADFSGAKIDGVDFRDSKLEYADFSSASITDARFNSEGTCLNNVNFETAKCNDANFNNATLKEVDFTDASLEGASFCDADLSHATFEGAVAREAILSGSMPRSASFVGANIEDAKFQEADVSEATFSNAVLTGADFRGAELADTDFRSVSANSNTEFGVRNYHECKADMAAEEHIKSEKGLKLEQLTEYEGNWSPSFLEWILCYFFVSIPRGIVRLGSSPKVGDGPELDKAVHAYQAVQRVFRENSMSSLVRRYEIRERDAQRKRALTCGNCLRWIWLSAMRKLFLYSHGPRYLIASTSVTIGLFTLFLIITGVTIDGTTYEACRCFRPLTTAKAIVRTSEVSLLAFLPGGSTGAHSKWFGRVPFTLLSTLGTLGVSAFVVTLVQRVQH